MHRWMDPEWCIASADDQIRIEVFKTGVPDAIQRDVIIHQRVGDAFLIQRRLHLCIPYELIDDENVHQRVRDAFTIHSDPDLRVAIEFDDASLFYLSVADAIFHARWFKSEAAWRENDTVSCNMQAFDSARLHMEAAIFRVSDAVRGIWRDDHLRKRRRIAIRGRVRRARKLPED